MASAFHEAIVSTTVQPSRALPSIDLLTVGSNVDTSASVLPRRRERQVRPLRRKDVHKEESMRIRVSKSDKEVLELAAARVGLGVSAFVLSAALEKARSALGT